MGRFVTVNRHARHDHLPHQNEEIGHLIANVPIFSGLSSEEVADLATRVRPKNYPAGEQLYGAGDSNSNLLIIHTGTVKIYRLSESGHEQVIRVLGPGDFLGEASFLNAEPMDHFAVTVQPGEICALHAQDLRDHMLRSPSVAVTMLATLSNRLESTEERLSSLTSETAGRRVAGYLLNLERETGRQRVRFPVAKKDVASQLGLTPETLSRKLAQFEDAGLIRVAGSHVDLLDAQSLRAAGN